jgi:cellobiose phosphorylase
MLSRYIYSPFCFHYFRCFIPTYNYFTNLHCKKEDKMKFGHFDDSAREYVIDRPDTPRPWCNYLGSTEYGSIITGNAGGYSFYKSAAQGRFLRARLNTLPSDEPGRYVYIHDHAGKDYWSASWKPVQKPLSSFKSVCRHGTGYTIISSTCKDVESEITYFVPMNRLFEIWKIKISNKSNRTKRISVFPFVEYANIWNAVDDMINLQYTQYTLAMKYKNGFIDHGTNINMPEMPDNFQFKDQGRHTFMGIIGAKVCGFDTDRESFIGNNRSYANPAVVEKGKCTNSTALGDNGCGVMQIKLAVKPGRTEQFAVCLGIGKADIEGKKAAGEFKNMKHIDSELLKLKTFWHSKISSLQCKTPDNRFNSMFNTWNPYNNLLTFTWSRAASLIYNGERDGLGYRDTVQDMLGICHNIPDMVRSRLELMITGQSQSGGAMSVVKPFAHKPGKEPTPASYRCDDCLWLFNTVPAYVKETGDISFFDKTLPFCDKGKDTVLGHLRRAIEFSLKYSGRRGLPCGLEADWNDCVRLGHDGESVFAAFQLRLALSEYISICSMLKNKPETAWAQPHLARLDKNLEKYAWDGKWYARAFRADGMKFGSKDCDEGKIFLNPQVWAIISGHAKGKRAAQIMDSVKKHLFTSYGIELCSPPFTVKTDWRIMLACLVNPGMKENGGIFNHTQGWAVMAEAMLGHGNQAYEYYNAFLPSAYNDKAEIRETEPYVYSQSTHGRASPRFGASRVPWLSGTASWAYYSAAQYILGVKPEYNGIRIDPAINPKWKKIQISRIFRGKKLEITIRNPLGIQHGVKRISVNGTEIKGNMIPKEMLKENNWVEVRMG